MRATVLLTVALASLPARADVANGPFTREYPDCSSDVRLGARLERLAAPPGGHWWAALATNPTLSASDGTPVENADIATNRGAVTVAVPATAAVGDGFLLAFDAAGDFGEGDPPRTTLELTVIAASDEGPEPPAVVSLVATRFRQRACTCDDGLMTMVARLTTTGGPAAAFIVDANGGFERGGPALVEGAAETELDVGDFGDTPIGPLVPWIPPLDMRVELISLDTLEVLAAQDIAVDWHVPRDPTTEERGCAACSCRGTHTGAPWAPLSLLAAAVAWRTARAERARARAAHEA